MIWTCPYCGFGLKKPVLHGLSSCCNCCRVFESSDINKLLSASWLVRKNHITSEEVLMHYGFTYDESKFVIEAVIDNCFSHEDFSEMLNKHGAPVFNAIC
jgi:hypothetical protein